MKIICDTRVVNRETQVATSKRYLKATLGLGYRPSTTSGNKEKDKEAELIHFPSHNKAGIRYKIKDNVKGIHSKFWRDGKATICFNQPPEDIMIVCDPLQLKNFISVVCLAAKGQPSQHLRLNVASITSVPSSSQPVHKLVVREPGDYPSKGFPKTLKHIVIESCGISRVPFAILSLRHLTTLHLNNNRLTEIPPAMGQVPLVELNLSNNIISSASNSVWKFLKGFQIRQTLLTLDVSNNKLHAFPKLLLGLEQLVELNLNQNHISMLPFGLRRMHRLRSLYLAENQLESLPAVFTQMQIHTLNVWNNHFMGLDMEVLDLQSSRQTVSSLLLQAARVVHRCRLHYTASALPETLIDLLVEAPICDCGKLSFPAIIQKRACPVQLKGLTNLVFDRDRALFEDIALCGPKCKGIKRYKSTRNQL